MDEMTFKFRRAFYTIEDDINRIVDQSTNKFCRAELVKFKRRLTQLNEDRDILLGALASGKLELMDVAPGVINADIHIIYTMSYMRLLKTKLKELEAAK